MVRKAFHCAYKHLQKEILIDEWRAYSITIDVKSGVYKIQCGECPSSYIGQTRLNELKYALTSSQPNESSFAAHLLVSGKSFLDLEISIPYMRRVLETNIPHWRLWKS